MSVKHGTEKPEKFPVPALEDIPKELREQKQSWAYWRWERPKGRKWTKVAYPFDEVALKNKARSNCPEDWGQVDEAALDRLEGDERLDGLAFRMPTDEYDTPLFTSLDFDNCRDPEKREVEKWAIDIANGIKTYTEISPSGEGLKSWMLGPPPDDHDWKQTDGQLELFTGESNRYLCFTGKTWGPWRDLEVAADSDYLHDVLIERMQREHKDAQVQTGDVDWELQKLESAIDWIIESDNDAYLASSYDTWIRFGMAIKNLSDSDAAFDIWHKWSETADNYEGEDDCQKSWDSFKPMDGGVTVGSIYYHALSFDWDAPRKRYGLDDTGTAKRVADRLSGRVWHISEWNGFYTWDGRKFDSSGRKVVNDAIVAVSHELEKEAPEGMDEKEVNKYYQFCCSYRNASRLNGTAGLVKNNLDVSASKFDQNPLILPVENGVLDFGTKGVEFRGHDPSDLNTRCTEVVYNPEAKAPRWRRFMDEVTDGDGELAEYLQKLVGVCLTGLTPEEAVYTLVGDGCNGKSLFIDVLMDLLGGFSGIVNQAAIVDDKRSNVHETELFACYNARLVVTEETDEGARLRENQVKAICSNGRMKARELYQKPITFNRTHKLWMTTNHLPYISGTDRGVWRRIRIIPFHVSFLGKEDRDLPRKLKREISGILNWAIEGYIKFRSDGLSPPKTVEYQGEQYQSDMDNLATFIEEELEIKEDHRESCQDVYSAYKYWMRERGLGAKGYNGFVREVMQKLAPSGVEKRKGRPTNCPVKSVICFHGLAFIDGRSE